MNSVGRNAVFGVSYESGANTHGVPHVSKRPRLLIAQSWLAIWYSEEQTELAVDKCSECKVSDT